MAVGGSHFKPLLFFTLPICGLVIILACTSIISESWVTGKATFVSPDGDGAEDNSLTYNYGLFAGKKKRVVAGLTKIDDVAGKSERTGADPLVV